MQCNLFRKLEGAAFVALIALLLTSSTSAQSYKVLYTFTGGSDGNGPNSPLAMDAAGNLYGTTSTGGAYGWGTVFKLAQNSAGTWTESVLYSFTGGTDGREPMQPVSLDAAGNIYGTTAYGGDVGGVDCSVGPWYCGVIFKLAPNADGTWTESVLYSFDGNYGWNASGVVLDAAGNLYGTTDYGGECVYELTPNSDGSWTFNVVFAFDETNGLDPFSPLLTWDSAGNLYGTTAYGGRGTDCWNGTCGLVYELAPSGGGWDETIIHSFMGGNDGATPFTGLVFDKAGNLYGTTYENGSGGYGTVFRITSWGGKWKNQVIHAFSGSDGQGPLGMMVFDRRGRLYGVTQYGGRYGNGTVYQMVRNSSGQWTEKTIHNFVGYKDGSGPTGGLSIDAAGNLYGASGQNSSHGYGVIFEITP